MGHFHIAKKCEKKHHSNGAKKPRPRSHPAYQTDCLRSCVSNSMDLLRCGSTVDRTWIKNWVWKALEDEIPTYSYWIWPWFRLFKHRLTSFFMFRWEKNWCHNDHSWSHASACAISMTQDSLEERCIFDNMAIPVTAKSLPGWWLTYPSEKYESQLRLLFPTYGK